MGAVGLVAVQSVTMLRWRSANAFRVFAIRIFAGELLFLFLGVSPDVVAHLGGFVTGLFLGSLL